MLALIAGQGELPEIIAQSVTEPIMIAALEGAETRLSPDRRFRIEQLGSFLADLSSDGVTSVVFAGGIDRPPLDPSAVDAATMPLVPRMMQALQRGDDAALRTVLAFFEEAGVEIKAAHDLVPSLLPGPGVATSAKPGPQHERDAERGQAVVSALGAADVGQACVIKSGQALVVEGAFGTEWMLSSLANRPDGTGGVLVKAPKPGQDRRVDLPTIGPETVDQAASAGLDGIVVEAGGVMLLRADEVIAKANEKGLFLWVRPV